MILHQNNAFILNWFAGIGLCLFSPAIPADAGGWLDGGVSQATDTLAGGSHAPITFNDQIATPQLNQLNVYAEQLLDQDAADWGFGGRLDLMFGGDSRYTQAAGLDDKLLPRHGPGIEDLAIPQAYVEIKSPFRRGLSAKLGHFYTLAGQEAVAAPNNFFYSHAYAMQYGEPFTHTGLLLSDAVNDNYTLSAGAVNGWDNFSHDLATWDFLGNLSWTGDSAANSVAWSVITGGDGRADRAGRSLSSLVVSHRFSGGFRYALQQDFAAQQGGNTPRAAFWYGVNQYLFYEINPRASAGLRAEWFRDNNGTRVNPGKPGDYLALTAGLNYKPVRWLSCRPELRYDWSDAGLPYASQTRRQQFELAVDFIAAF